MRHIITMKAKIAVVCSPKVAATIKERPQGLFVGYRIFKIIAAEVVDEEIVEHEVEAVKLLNSRKI